MLYPKLRDVRAVRYVRPARRSGRLALTERWFDRRRPRSSSHPSWFVEYHRVRADPHLRSHSADSHTHSRRTHSHERARTHTGQATVRAHTQESWLQRMYNHTSVLSSGCCAKYSISFHYVEDHETRFSATLLHPDHCYRRRRRCLGGAHSYAMTSSSSAAATYMLMLTLTCMLTTMLMTMLTCMLN